MTKQRVGVVVALLCPLLLSAAPQSRTQLKEEIKREVLAELQSDSANTTAATETKEGLWLGNTVRVTGQVRVRPEIRNDLTRGAVQVPTTKRTEVASALRARLGAEFAPTEHIGFFVQAQDSRYFGETANTVTDSHNLDLHQGYIDITNIGGHPLMIRAGRQEIKLGEERLIGSPDWSNVGRAYDAVVVSYQPDNWGLTGMAAITDRTPANGAGQYAGGLYGTWKKFPGGVWDGYYLLLQDNDGATGAAAGTSANLTIHTVGTRIASQFANGLDLGVEAAAQLGSFGSNRVLAYAGHAASGYTAPVSWKPRIGLEYNYASGDDSATARYTKFHNLLPTNHNKYGLMDIATWSNIHDASLQLSAKPGKWSASLAYHLLAVDQPHSAGDTFAGSFAGAAGLGRIAGHEIDLQAKWKMNPYFELGAGVGHFMPGAFLKDQGFRRNADFAYLSTTAQF